MDRCPPLSSTAGPHCPPPPTWHGSLWRIQQGQKQDDPLSPEHGPGRSTRGTLAEQFGETLRLAWSQPSAISASISLLPNCQASTLHHGKAPYLKMRQQKAQEIQSKLAGACRAALDFGFQTSHCLFNSSSESACLCAKRERARLARSGQGGGTFSCWNERKVELQLPWHQHRQLQQGVLACSRE